jgi:hypothetical protein
VAWLTRILLILVIEPANKVARKGSSQTVAVALIVHEHRHCPSEPISHVNVENASYLNWPPTRSQPAYLFFLTAYVRCRGHANVISLPI